MTENHSFGCFDDQVAMGLHDLSKAEVYQKPKEMTEELKQKAKESVKQNCPMPINWNEIDVAERAGYIKGYIAGATENGIQWHKVADGDLPNTETMDYTYIRRRKRYEREFTEYKVIKCFVALVNEKGKTMAEIGYFDCKQKKFLDSAEGTVYAWQEINLPQFKE